MSLRIGIGWDSADATTQVFELWDDGGVPDDWLYWTDLLKNATTVLVEWSNNLGVTWHSFLVTLDDPQPQVRRYLRGRVNKQIADGTTEYLVRFTVDGVLLSPVYTLRFGPI